MVDLGDARSAVAGGSAAIAALALSDLLTQLGTVGRPAASWGVALVAGAFVWVIARLGAVAAAAAVILCAAALLAGLAVGPEPAGRAGEIGSLAPGDLLARLAATPVAYALLGVAFAAALRERARRVAGRRLSGTASEMSGRR